MHPPLLISEAYHGSFYLEHYLTFWPQLICPRVSTWAYLSKKKKMFLQIFRLQKSHSILFVATRMLRYNIQEMPATIFYDMGKKNKPTSTENKDERQEKSCILGSILTSRSLPINSSLHF